MTRAFIAILLLSCAVLGCQREDSQPLPSEDPVATSSAEPSSESPPALDTVIVRDLAILPENGVATMRQQMFTADWSEPVVWSLTITNDRDTLWHEARDSSTFDDIDYWLDCATPAECAELWFTGDFLTPKIETTTIDEFRDFIPLVPREDYLALGYKEEDASALTEQLVNYYADRPLTTIWFNYHPNVFPRKLAYDPSTRRLISVYTP